MYRHSPNLKSSVKQNDFVDNNLNESQTVTNPAHSFKDIQLKSKSVVQLVKTDSGIPPFLLEFFEKRGTTYHEFKQNNWHLISQAFEQARGKAPTTTKAKFTIDAKTGRALIKILGNDWQAHSSPSSASAAPLPSASAVPLPSASAAPLPSASAVPLPSASAVPLPSAPAPSSIPASQITIYNKRNQAEKAVKKGRVPTSHFQIKGEDEVHAKDGFTGF